MKRVARSLAVCGFIVFAACSGGGGSRSIPSAPGQPPISANTRVTFKLLIPAASTAPAFRKRAFVSPSTNGVSVTTYAHSDTNHTTPLSVSVTDVSGGSSACSGGAGARTCTVPVAAPAGNDDFVFALYDTAPVGGAIPSGAHELGIATVTQSIAANTTNTVAAPVSGIIAGFGATTQTIGFGSDGHAHAVTLVIAPTDFGDNAITTGTSNAPFQNPITATVAETGGSGQVTLSLNGGAASPQVTITKATDAVTATYAGGGSAGYHATVTLSAPAFAGESATQQNLILNRSALTVSNPTVFYSPQPAVLNAYPSGQQVLAISDPGAAGGTTFTATPSGCTGIMNVGTPVGSGTAATLFVAAGATLSTSGCTIAIGDGTATYTVYVTNALRPAPPAPGSAVITEYAIGASGPTGITTGADGNLWFTECGGGYGAPAISSIKPNGTGYTQHPTTPSGITSPQGDALGPDGNIWFGDNATATIASISTSGAIVPYTTAAAGANYFAAGLDGKVWFDENFGADLGNVTTASGVTEVPAYNMIQGVALGPDGQIWFADCTDQLLGETTQLPTGAFNASPIPNEPFTLVAGSDGNTWFATSSAVGHMSSTGTSLAYPVYSSPGVYWFMTVGPDGAIWLASTFGNTIDRIATNGSETSYPVPTSGADPYGITVGPDGNIWFTEQATGKIGVLTL